MLYSFAVSLEWYFTLTPRLGKSGGRDFEYGWADANRQRRLRMKHSVCRGQFEYRPYRPYRSKCFESGAFVSEKIYLFELLGRKPRNLSLSHFFARAVFYFKALRT